MDATESPRPKQEDGRGPGTVRLPMMHSTHRGQQHQWGFAMPSLKGTYIIQYLHSPASSRSIKLSKGYSQTDRAPSPRPTTSLPKPKTFKGRPIYIASGILLFGLTAYSSWFYFSIINPINPPPSSPSASSPDPNTLALNADVSDRYNDIQRLPSTAL